MTSRRPPRTTTRHYGSRPSTDRLFQKPITTWYAEWKARRSDAPAVPQNPPAAPRPA